MEILFYSLSIVVTLFLLLIFSLYIYLLFQYKKQSNIEQHVNIKSEYYFNRMLSIIFDKDYLSNEDFPKSHEDYIALERVLVYLAQHFQGEELNETISSYADGFFSNQFKKKLKGKSWSIRINTLHRIYQLDMKSLEDELKEMILNGQIYTKEENFQMMKIMFRMDGFFALEQLSREALKLNDFDQKRLLYEMEDQYVFSLMEQFNELNYKLQLNIIEVIGIRRFPEAVLFLEDQLHSLDSETRIRSLKSISNIGYVENVEKYHQFVTANNWEERLMLAKILAFVRSNRSVNHLVTLMHDNTWAVRVAAANSLMVHKNGKAVIENLFDYSEDQFTKDVAKEVLVRSNS
ncbi:HEAT repeat domain-containing protein [Halalkalibacillus halophilus]|uniref:HEAT repeat domain-containing protein n=1 Tax=Halalkalibacillus halophilus TaxID=392827 RepID=UPI000483C7A6|nr:HEAT repeat domain-containing protein [Halalkalibacillus halophilus]